MVQLTVRVTAARDVRGALIGAFKSIMDSTRCETGCVDAHLACDADHPDVVWYLEEWDSLPRFEAHLRSAQFTRLVALVETSAAQPLLECRLVSESRGLDYIASVRGVHDLALDGQATDGTPPGGGGRRE